MEGGWSNWYAKIRGFAVSVEGEVIRQPTELGIMVEISKLEHGCSQPDFL